MFHNSVLRESTSPFSSFAELRARIDTHLHTGSPIKRERASRNSWIGEQEVEGERKSRVASVNWSKLVSNARNIRGVFTVEWF